MKTLGMKRVSAFVACLNGVWKAAAKNEAINQRDFIVLVKKYAVGVQRLFQG